MALFAGGGYFAFMASNPAPTLQNKAFMSKIQCSNSCCHRFKIYSCCNCIPLKYSNCKAFMPDGDFHIFRGYASDNGSSSLLYTTPFLYPRKILANVNQQRFFSSRSFLCACVPSPRASIILS